MPKGDRTGPQGLGPMTGRRAGYCAGYPVPGYMNPIPARGGFGFGRGWGRGRRGYGRGWGQGLGFGQGAYPNAYGNPNLGYAYGGKITPAEEAGLLREQAQTMQEEIKAIQSHIKELESLAKTDEK